MAILEDHHIFYNHDKLIKIPTIKRKERVNSQKIKKEDHPGFGGKENALPPGNGNNALGHHQMY